MLNQSLGCIHHRSGLRELNFLPSPSGNIRNKEMLIDDRKAFGKSKQNNEFCDKQKINISRQYSNQNVNLMENNMRTSYFNPAKDIIKLNDISRSLKVMRKPFRTNSDRKQVERTIYLIRSHLELISSKVNEFEYELIGDESCQKEIRLDSYQPNADENQLQSQKVKRLNKLVRLLKIAQKFAFQNQFQSEQTQIINQSQFQSNIKQEQSTFINTFQKSTFFQNQQLPQQQPQQIKSLNNPQKISSNSKKQQIIFNIQQKNVNGPQTQSQQNKSSLKHNDPENQIYFQSEFDKLQVKFCENLNINQVNLSTKRKLFSQNQNHLPKTQTIFSSFSTQIAIKTVSLSIHILNLLKHELSQTFEAKIRKERFKMQHDLRKKMDKKQNYERKISEMEQNQQQMNGLRDILVDLKRKTQQFYKKYNKQYQKCHQSVNYSGTQFTLRQLYRQVKHVFRKLEKYSVGSK